MLIGAARILTELGGKIETWYARLILAVVEYTICCAGMNLIKLSHIKKENVMVAFLKVTLFNKCFTPLHATLTWISETALTR